MQRFIRHKNPNSPKSIALEIARNVEVKTYGSSLPFELILAMIDTESNFDPYAVSNKEAHGLMQIKVGEFIDNKKKIVIEKDKIHDIDYNIISGINVFNEHLTLSNGNVRQALTTYVGGDKEYSNKVLQTIGEWVLFRYELGI
jgi:soluble lytic murein transglycosylase-like protein